ncbi:MAG: TIM-barrel domain-containing protein [Isosphaerales bacterium]
MSISRRAALLGLGVSGATTLLGASTAAAPDATFHIAGRPVELAVTAVGEQIVRLSIVPVEQGRSQPVSADLSLVERDWGAPIVRLTSLAEPRSVACGDARVTVSADPLTVRIVAANGRLVQQFRFDAQTAGFAFHLGEGPILGLGEGGPQFDRRGSVDRMRNGQGGYRLRTHGGRVPVPWLIGTAGWAIFIHQPAGTFDLTGTEGVFAPARGAAALPLDIFIVTAREPARMMAEYARLTGHPEMPPLWALGYQQSHRTLASRDEVLSEARTFREKKLPCDVLISTWATLQAHVPVAINTSLTGIPYWGTDIGGFVPTRELTGELYIRWFQFSAFCPLFRSHGRTWKLRLLWGWNTGELGPNEIRTYGDAANPDPGELHNAAVEPICRKYLELRYRLLPYLYSVVREGCLTGLPIMRALWLHDPDDQAGCARGDEYLWGPNILVAPVTEKGAVTRRLYLPRGLWYDFWTGEAVEGGHEINRPVDLETLPLYVRAGSILPLGPVKQYTAEAVDGPLTLRVYPGADGRFILYEDDGLSFGYHAGDWMGIDLSWDDRGGRLSIKLADGSRMRSPLERRIEVHKAPAQPARSTVFTGRAIELGL